MKKHPFIQIEFHSTVKLSAAQSKKIHQWLDMASEAIEALLKENGIIQAKWLKTTKSIRISVLLCGESRIKKLNQEYRQKNKVTDVLSFPSYSSLRVAPARGESLPPELFIGDLAICQQRIISQAKEFNITYFDEFIHLFMHGVTHLLGYDHELSAKEEVLMEKWERVALDSFSKIKKKGP